MKKKGFIYFSLFLFLISYSCLDTPDMTVGIANMKEEPTVVSGAGSSISTEGSISLTGEIQSVGKTGKIFKKGFCWGYNENKLTDSVFLESAQVEPGLFSYILSNIRGDTTVYWQAFAGNDYGWSFGEIRITKTPPIFLESDAFRGLPHSYFASFTLKNNLYITSGYNNALYRDVWRYNAIQGWYNLPDFPGTQRRYPVAFSINDSLAYVGTGQGYEGAIFGDFYVFNGNTQDWAPTLIQTPQEMLRYGAVAFSLNNKGYVVGGKISEYELLSDVWEFSFTDSIGSLEKKKDFPTPLPNGMCFYNKNRVFVGFNNRSVENTLWEYDAVNDDWKEFPTILPTYQGGRLLINSGVMYHNKIYLLDYSNIIWELDLETKMFKQKSTLPQIFSPLTDYYMFTLDDAVYIGLGGKTFFYRYYPLWDN